MEIFSLQWKWRDNWCLCTQGKAGVCHAQLWWTTNFGSFQKQSVLVLGIILSQELQTGSGNSKKDTQ